MRKPLSGQLAIRIVAIKDVDHATTGRFSRGPETSVSIKVEDNVMGRTKTSRNDRWEGEYHAIDVDKANEVELTVYDRPGEHPMPIAMIWVRISDIVEEMRRKRIEAEMSSSGWVSADRMGNNGQGQGGQFGGMGGQGQYGGGNGGYPQPGAGGQPPYGAPGPQPQVNTGPIDGWFNLEPAGQIQLQLSFIKQNKDRRQVDVGLGRKGAVRQRKEEIHEMYGHKFVQHQFYNIMRCAVCGEFLKASAGMQCEDCKYTCHTKCYPSVVTKCISKSHGEQDPDEETINHRIPHRFQAFANVTANWCCHCGYILPLGKKNCRKCTECSLTCHANCSHLVPDFCGMSMQVASEILRNLKGIQGGSKVTKIEGKTLRPGASNRRSSATPSQPRLTPSTNEAAEAARVMYQNQLQQQQQQDHRMSQQSRPVPVRVPSDNHSPTAAAAAAAAMTGLSGQQQQLPQQQRPNQPYGYGGNSQYSQQPQATYNPSDYARVDNAYSQPPQPNQPAQQRPAPAQAPTPTSAAPPTLPPMFPPANAGARPDHQAPPASSANAMPVARKSDLPSATDSGTGMRIGLDHFNFLSVLGKGNFGKVMLAETKRSRRLYAIKVLKKEFIIENDEVESMKSEKRVFLIANRERHPFLTNLSACFQTETRVYFVMEYVSGGDLMLHIQRGQFGAKRAQ